MAEANGVKAVECTHWSDGGAGTEELAHEVVALVDGGHANFAPLYADEMPIWDKIKTIATRLYRADDIIADKKFAIKFKICKTRAMGIFQYVLPRANTASPPTPISRVRRIIM